MEQVRTQRDGRVLTVTLDNPPRNFMTGQMVGELDDLTRSLEDDRSIGAVVLTGAPDDIFITHFDVDEIAAGARVGGRRFSSTQAGAGLKVVGALERVPGARGALESSPAGGLIALRAIHDVFNRMNRLDKVFVAAINGVAMGGGFELALACDIRLMADGEGRVGLPEATLALIPGAGGTQRMTRILGESRALEMMLEGRTLQPREAERLGLVHRVVPRERLLAEAQDTAARMARRPPEVVAALKRAVYEGAARPRAEGLHIEQAGFMAAASTPAALRAMEAYLEQQRANPEPTLEELPGLLEPWQQGTAVDLTEPGT